MLTTAHDGAAPPPPIPAGPDDVTPRWLSQALSAAGVPTVVAAVEPERLIPGAATKLRIRLRYDRNPRGLPELMWVKAGWEAHSPGHRLMRLYEREARFYAAWAPIVGTRAPRCFHAAHDGDGDAVLLLEDLADRGATLWTCTTARGVDDVAALLDGLARLHARTWDAPALPGAPPLDVPIRSSGPLSEWPRANGGARIAGVLAGPRGEGLPAHVRDGARVEAAFWRMVAAMETAAADAAGCVLHGDPHPGNCFQDADGGVGLYDWQTLARGPWAFDVAYAIVGALDPAVRRAGERALLDFYLAALRAHGVAAPPERAAAWDAYRRHVAYGLLIWPTNHVSHQPEDVIRAMTLRFGMAAADLGLLGLWEV